MKKFLSIAIAFALTVGVATAQSSSGTVVLKSSPTHVPTDTVVNAAVKFQSAPISIINTLVTIQTTLTKISGTAAGVVRLYGSLDGVTYVRANPTDSLIVSNVASQSKAFIVNPAPYSYYRVGYTGAGTQSVKISTIAAYRKQ